MSEAQVISVNPGMKTRGELGGMSRTGRKCLASISRCISSPTKTVVSHKKSRSFCRLIVDFLFGVSSKVSFTYSSKMLLVRLLTGVALILSQLLPISPEDILAMQIPVDALIICCIGVSIVLGLFSRIASFGGATLLSIWIAMSIMQGAIDMAAGWMALMMLTNSILGPGLYSADQLMRKGILNLRARIVRKRRKAVKEAINYGAYGEIERRV